MSDTRLWVELGERYAALGLPAAARAVFDRAAARDPADPLPVRRAAELSLAIGDDGRARAEATAAARIAPGPAASILLGRASLASGELSAARLAFAQALEASDPPRVRAHLGRAAVALGEADRAGAVAHALAATDAVIDEPLDDGELAAIDELAQLLHAVDGAVDAEQRIAERPGSDGGALLAAALAMAGRADRRAERAAEEALAQVVARRPHARAVALRWIERRLARRPRDPAEHAAALADLERLVHDQAQVADGPAELALLARLWFALAAALEGEAGQHGRAAAAYRRGLELRPGHAVARHQLAALAIGQGDGEAGIAELEASLRLDPGDGPGWRTAARLVELAGPRGASAVGRLLDAAAPGAAAAGPTAARLFTAAAEVAREGVLGGVYTRGHRLKNQIGVLAARARAARKSGEDPAIAELERLLAALYDEWAIYLRSMESAGPRLEVIALAPIVAEVLAVARGPIECRVAAGLPELRGDRLLLREALGNLVDNAIDACEGGGRVELSVRPQPGNASLIEIVVADGGVGIAAADLPRLFSPGFTTKPSGSGIGLAVAARAIEAHHGRIRVDSEPGRGTRVTVLLPIDVAGRAGWPLGGGA